MSLIKIIPVNCIMQFRQANRFPFQQNIHLFRKIFPPGRHIFKYFFILPT